MQRCNYVTRVPVETKSCNQSSRKNNAFDFQPSCRYPSRNTTLPYRYTPQTFGVLGSPSRLDLLNYINFEPNMQLLEFNTKFYLQFRKIILASSVYSMNDFTSIIKIWKKQQKGIEQSNLLHHSSRKKNRMWTKSKRERHRKFAPQPFSVTFRKLLANSRLWKWDYELRSIARRDILETHLGIFYWVSM